jgi:hypothetical protein
MKWEEGMFQHMENTSNDYIDIKEDEIGRVISINPLQISVEGLPLTKDNIYINPTLLEHTMEVTTLTGTIGDSQTTISNGSILFKSSLNEKDLVALRLMKNGKYLVRCKIVGGDSIE